MVGQRSFHDQLSNHQNSNGGWVSVLACLLIGVLFCVYGYSQVPIPAHIGSITNTGSSLLSNPTSIYVSGQYAYVASSNKNALDIIDISNPTLPAQKGSLVDGFVGAVLNYPNSVFVAGNYAYVASFGSNALEIIDVTNPGAPSHKSSISNGVGGAMLSGSVAVFVANLDDISSIVSSNIF